MFKEFKKETVKRKQKSFSELQDLMEDPRMTGINLNGYFCFLYK